MSAARLESKPLSPRKEKWNKYVDSMKYAFHVIFHPFDGFWDLTHEKRGTLAAATTWLALFLITRVMELMFTNFQFINAPLQYINIFEQMASLLFPFLILCLANWSLTTLFDGEGSLKDIFIATSYSLIPLPLLIIPSTIASNFVTTSEVTLVNLLADFAFIWAILLIFFGMMVTHDYTLTKNLVICLCTIVGMVFIMFVGILFSTLLGKIVSFISNIIIEINYRL